MDTLRHTASVSDCKAEARGRPDRHICLWVRQDVGDLESASVLASTDAISPLLDYCGRWAARLLDNHRRLPPTRRALMKSHCCSQRLRSGGSAAEEMDDDDYDEAAARRQAAARN